MTPLAEIVLPLPAPAGEFHGLYRFGGGVSSRALTSIQVARDQSLLTFQPEPDGKWLLVRTRDWWTTHPVNEVLSIPEWRNTEMHGGDLNGVDLQITPDGRYAVAFAQADWSYSDTWNSVTSHVSKSDTSITLVDLARWEIANTIHMNDLENSRFRGARVLNDQWIALQGFAAKSSESHGEYRDLLISIPDLKPGSGCFSNRPELLFGSIDDERLKQALEKLEVKNRADCKDLLHAAGVPSMQTYESLIYKGQPFEPQAIRQQTSPGEQAESGGSGVLQHAIATDQMSYYNQWEHPHYGTYSRERPVESESGHWYVVRDLAGTGGKLLPGQLEIFDSDGNKLSVASPAHLLCSQNPGRTRKGGCACRVDEVSDTHGVVMTFCNTYNRDSWGVEHTYNQWLSLFQPDSLSEMGIIDLGKDNNTQEALAVADGHSYVLTLAGGVLRVYAVPESSLHGDTR